MLLKTLVLFFTLQTLAKGSSNNSYRLPTDIIPEHYTLTILTRLEDDFKFNGHVDIEVKCVVSTSSIYLHAKNLTIAEGNVTIKDRSSNETVKVTTIDKDEDKDFLILRTEKPLVKDGKYVIGIDFEGPLSDKLNGYYRSYYESKDGKKKWLTVTQFEPTHARQAFPCFDEPSMKAVFQIILGRKEGYMSLSNMRIEETKPINNMPGWYWDVYENSVPMSTYLVAYSVSDFVNVTSTLKQARNNVIFKVWTRKDAAQQVDLANEVGPRALAFFEDFYDVPYPLPKQDMIAIPDFSAGAMENWGLITYRETALLYDRKTSTAVNRHRVASVIAHELAHQWFGNLVTMRWWTDLWLNEGFATYMASLAIDNLYPEWHSLEGNVVQEFLTVSEIDALKTSHPVSVTIDNPALINEIFDSISYDKGSALIRMMDNFLGNKVLKEGLSNYLKNHEYDNADQDDLWEFLTIAAHKNKALPESMTVKLIMDSWTLQTGYPVVELKRNYTDGTATLRQKRFLRDTIIVKDAAPPPCWWIPISYTTQTELDVNTTTPKTWMECPLNATTLKDIPPREWILLNLQIASMYKINYDEENWQMLTKTLNSKEYDSIPVLNRVQLIDDAAQFAWVGMVKYQLVFDILRYLTREEEFSPWLSALKNLADLDEQTRQHPSYKYFKMYMRNLLKPQYDKIGFNISLDDERLDSVMRQTTIIGKSCSYEIPECLSEAKRLFGEYQAIKDGENTIPTNLRQIVYCYGLKEAGAKEWNFIWDQYKKSNSANERNMMIMAMGCTKDVELLKNYLELTIRDGSGIRRQDSAMVFRAVLSNKDGGFEIAKDFFYTKFKDIYDYNKGETRTIARYLKPLAKRITKNEYYEEFNNFLKKYEEELLEIKQAVSQSRETSKLNLQWQQKHRSEVEELFKKFAESN